MATLLSPLSLLAAGILCAAVAPDARADEPVRPATQTVSDAPLLPAGCDPLEGGKEVMARLIRVTAPHVQGAHDAEFELVGRHAYIVSTVNDVRPGHSAADFEYAAMSIVNLDTLEVEVASLPIARSEQAFENETLPVGQCWVPRVIRKGDDTLRVFFVSQRRGAHCQVWYRDFDLPSRTFANRIERAKLKTSLGTFDMQPEPFHACAAAHGFRRAAADHGLYVLDSFKEHDGVIWLTISGRNQRTIMFGKLEDL